MRRKERESLSTKRFRRFALRFASFLLLLMVVVLLPPFFCSRIVCIFSIFIAIAWNVIPFYGLYNPKSFSVATLLKHFHYLYFICTVKTSADTYWNFAFFLPSTSSALPFDRPRSMRCFIFIHFLRVANAKVILLATMMTVDIVRVSVLESHKISNEMQYFRKEE